MANANALIDTATLTKAGALRVFDQVGNEHTFSSVLAHDKTTCVIFIRHFHCGQCQDYLCILQDKIKAEQIASANAKMVIIGCGDWQMLTSYIDVVGLKNADIYANPDRSIYTLLGMTKRTWDRGQTPEYNQRSFVSNFTMSLSRAFKIGIKHTSGDRKALGGEFVFKPDSDGSVKCTFAHRMEDTRDHATPQELAREIGIVDIA